MSTQETFNEIYKEVCDRQTDEPFEYQPRSTESRRKEWRNYKRIPRTPKARNDSLPGEIRFQCWVRLKMKELRLTYHGVYSRFRSGLLKPHSLRKVNGSVVYVIP